MGIYSNNGKRTFTIFKDGNIINFKPKTSIELNDKDARFVKSFDDIVKVQCIDDYKAEAEQETPQEAEAAEEEKEEAPKKRGKKSTKK